MLVANTEFTMTGFHYRFAQHRNVLRRGLMTSDGPDDRIGLNYGVGLHFRATPRIAFEVGYAKSRMDLEVRDQKFLDGNNIDKPVFANIYRGAIVYDAQFDIAKLYNVEYFQIYYFNNPERKLQTYFSAGIARNFLDSKQTFSTATYNYDPTGEHMRLTAYFSPKYTSGFVETGICTGTGRYSGPVNFFLGVNLHIAGLMIAGDYSVSGGRYYTDVASATGSYFSISMRLGYTIGYLPHKERESSIHDRYPAAKRRTGPKSEKIKPAHHDQRGPAFKGFHNRKPKPKTGGVERRIQRTDN
jgi:hypothetical protein